MSRNASFVRKIAYIAAIAVLLLPLSALSLPATVEPNSPTGGSPGGKLSQLRAKYKLEQAQLGEIDPASETMKLATLGMRGVAANILWIWANHYKKVEDWDRLEMTVQQIIRLQPNFLEVWDFQAHNLSYNVSVEFDDYRMRYEWVKKGIRFLIEGTSYNREEPGLLNQVGWYTGQKVGRADEQKQFRRMFEVDKDFHQDFSLQGIEVDQEQALGPFSKPDNWLVARLWYNKAIDAVTFSGKPIRGKSPLLFYSGAPMSRINGSAAIQKDGYFGERSQILWQQAADEWFDYGNRELPASAGYTIRLNELELYRQRLSEWQAEIDKLAPGLREQLKKDKIAQLDPEVQAALSKPEKERTPDDMARIYSAGSSYFVTDRDVLSAAPREARPKIRTLVEQIETDSSVAQSIESNRRIVNFEYWRTRCAAEKTELALDARRDVYDADNLFASVEQFDKARQTYERAWDAWAKVFEEFPDLMGNAESQDLIESIERYRRLLGQLDEKFPADFKLVPLLQQHHEGLELLEQVKLLSDTPSGAAAPSEPMPSEPMPSEPMPGQPKPAEPPAAEAKPGDAKPEEVKPEEVKP